MNRLQSELHRLYLPRSAAPAETDAPRADLIDPLDRVRALVLQVTRPPSWQVLSKVWQGVQAELDLPAPAIAVSGTDAIQLWFALAEPVPIAQAHAFLDGLRSRYLPDIEPGRIGLMPALDASALHPARHARLVPARHEPSGNWSAFVAPDLAPVFGDTPWLDIPPGEDGQAALLSGLETMEQTVFEAAVKRLGSSANRAPPTEAVAVASATPADAALTKTRPMSAATDEDPKQFLLRIMNDATVALALRIEAAKALLQHAKDHRSEPGD